MHALNKLTITDFKCKLCNEVLVFDTDDPKTYVDKSESEDFFSMKLQRYVVKHTTTDEEHYNVVIVDQEHKYRGHKDFYLRRKLFARTTYRITTIDPLITHTKLDYLIIINLTTKEILEYINSTDIHTLNLCEKIVGFIYENKDLYKTLPVQLTYDYANKKFFILKKTEHTFIISSFYHLEDHQDYLEILQLFSGDITEVNDNAITNLTLATIIRASDLFNADLVAGYQYLYWITANNYIYTIFTFDSETLAYIHSFFSRIINSNPCVKKSAFFDIFGGKTTIIQYLQKNLHDLPCVKDTFDMLQDRAYFLVKNE